MFNQKKMIRAAVVGCGIILPYHAIPISQIEGVELVAICDNNIQLLKNSAQTYQCEGFENYEQMLDKISVDTLHICTPHHLHFPMYLKAMEKEINVIIEKPVAIKRNEIKKMISISKNSKTIDAGIFQNRFTRSSNLIKNALDKHQLGAITHCDINISTNTDKSDPWRSNKYYSGGGILIDFAIHYLDLVKWFINDDPTGVEVLNYKIKKNSNDIEETIEGILHFENNVNTTFYIADRNVQDRNVLITVQCEKGTAYFSGDKAKICFKNGSEIEDGLRNKDFFVYDNIGNRYWGMGHLEQIKRYYNSLKSKIKPDVDLIDACKSVEMILDIYEIIEK